MDSALDNFKQKTTAAVEGLRERAQIDTDFLRERAQTETDFDLPEDVLAAHGIASEQPLGRSKAITTLRF